MRRYHKLSLLALLAGALAQASQSLSAGSGAGTHPNSAPFTNLSSFRIEFRVHGPWTLSTIQTIYGSAAFSVRTLFGGFTLTSWNDGSSVCTVSPAAGADVTIRLQRLSSAQMTAEAFDNITGANLGSSRCTPSSPGTPNDGGATVTVGSFDGDISYIRGFQATVAPGTPPGNTTCSGDLLDFELEGNGNDCSGRSLHLTMAGASYIATPNLAPVARFNVWPVLSTTRAGAGSLPLSSSSFSSTDNASISYFWQQLAGPITGAFSSRTAASPAFAAPLAGTYTIQLSVCDSTGQCATPVAAKAGAVATDSKAVVVTGLSPAMDNLLGPLVLANATANPWPYGDLAEIGVGANIAATALSAPPQLGTQLPGTVSWALGNIIATTSDLRTPLSGQSYMAVTWDSADGPGTGRAICPISSVSATQVTCEVNIFAPGGSGRNAYLMPGTDSNGLNFLAWQNGSPATIWNYYDVGIALYRLYYRTGDNAFLTQARQFADIHWQWTLDHGYNYPYPRAASMISQFFRALDGHGERFPGLYVEVTKLAQSFGDPSPSPSIDNREAGYTLWDVALGAKTDADPTRHAQYCSWLSAYTSTWNAKQSADGSWGENEYMLNPSFVSAPKSFTPPFTYEGAPWREAINLKAMEAAYESLNDTGSQGCNNTSLAAAVLTAIKKAQAWVVNYGRDSVNRGEYYEVNSQSSDQATVYNPAGTVAINAGSTTLGGTGTHWLTAGYCDGSHFVGIQKTRTVYKITSCTSDTSATLSLAFGLYGETANVSGSAYSVAPAATAICNSLATYCFSDTGDRNLTRTGCGSMGWLYNTTGITMYKDWGDECYSSTLGGPPSGPDSSSGIGAFAAGCAGPLCDGYITDVVAGARDCNAGNTAPCTPGSYVFFNLGKNFGEAFGAPGIDNHLAWRLGGLAPAVNRTLWVSFSAAGVPQATQARITLTQPSGIIVTRTCSASPCAVLADARQGNHVAQLVYLSAGGQTLASADPMILVVQ
jgi:K319L-like, PKD domain